MLGEAIEGAAIEGAAIEGAAIEGAGIEDSGLWALGSGLWALGWFELGLTAPVAFRAVSGSRPKRPDSLFIGRNLGALLGDSASSKYRRARDSALFRQFLRKRAQLLHWARNS